MFDLLDTALAFSLTMLAASLFVSVVVQFIQGLLGMRGTQVIRMVQSIHLCYREHYLPLLLKNRQKLLADAVSQSHGTIVTKAYTEQIEEINKQIINLSPNDVRCRFFIADVLCDSSLHPIDSYQRFLVATKGKSPLNDQDWPIFLKQAHQIEYLAQDDLLRLVSKQWDLPSGYPQEGEPTRAETWWSSPLAKLAGPPSFQESMTYWFPTIEGTSAQDFKQRVRMITLWVSCAVVIVLNLDGLQLISTLNNEKTQRDFMVSQASNLLLSANRVTANDQPFGPPPVPATTHSTIPQSPAPAASPLPASETTSPTTADKALEIQKAVTILSDANIGLGWPKSWIVKEWAAFNHVEGGGDVTAPGAVSMAMDILRWIGGLLFSCALLSLGAPFWVTTVSDLINLKNEVQQRKESSDDSSSSSSTTTTPAAGPTSNSP